MFITIMEIFLSILMLFVIILIIILFWSIIEKLKENKIKKEKKVKLLKNKFNFLEKPFFVKEVLEYIKSQNEFEELKSKFKKFRLEFFNESENIYSSFCDLDDIRIIIEYHNFIIKYNNNYFWGIISQYEKIFNFLSDITNYDPCTDKYDISFEFLILNLILKLEELKDNRDYKGLEEFLEIIDLELGEWASALITQLSEKVLDKFNKEYSYNKKERKQLLEKIMKEKEIKNIDKIYEAIELYEEVNNLKNKIQEKINNSEQFLFSK